MRFPFFLFIFLFFFSSFYLFSRGPFVFLHHSQHIERIIEEQKANGTFKGFNEKEDKEDGGEEDEEEGGEDNDGEDDGGPARKRPKLTGKVTEDSDDEGKDGGEIDFRAAFDKEMDQLKEKDPSKKLASNVFIEMDCVLFIRVHSSIDPVEVVRRIFIEAETTKIAKTRHCSRFTPVEAVCHADFDSFEKLGPVFDKHFRQPDQKPCTVSQHSPPLPFLFLLFRSEIDIFPFFSLADCLARKSVFRSVQRKEPCGRD